MSIPPPGPLSYAGQVAIPFINETFAPASTDYKFSVPTIWCNTSSGNAYILTQKPLNVANWVEITNINDIFEITVDAHTAPGTNPVQADTNGNVNVTGGQVASGTIGANVIQTNSLAANTYTIQIQQTTTAASTDSTKNGVAHFNSAQFTVDTHGFVSLKGSGEAMSQFTPDSGTSPVVPSATGNVTMAGSGSITTVGGTNTLTTELTGLTAHSVLVGAGTTTITKVGPNSASGLPLISQGSTTDPAFGVATVPGGGTGDSSFTAYSVITGGTTSTGALQNVSGVGSHYQVLTSQGASALPAWGSNATYNFVSSKTPTAGSVIFTVPTPVANGTIFLTGFCIFPASSEDIYMLVSLDGTNYATTGYYGGLNTWEATAATWTNANATTKILLGTSVHQSGQGWGLNFQVYITPGPAYGPTNGLMINGSSYYGDLATPAWYHSLINATYSTGDQVSNVVSFKITSAGGLNSGGGSGAQLISLYTSYGI